MLSTKLCNIEMVIDNVNRYVEVIDNVNRYVDLLCYLAQKLSKVG